jgi:hypothetical protein
VARHDALLLVIARRVARELEDLRREVLEHRREVHCALSAPAPNHTAGRTGRARADALRVVAALEQAVYAPDGELQPGLGGAARAFARAALGRAARLAAAGRLAGLALAAL